MGVSLMWNPCLLRQVYFSEFEMKIRCQLQKSPIRLPQVIIELMRCFLYLYIILFLAYNIYNIRLFEIYTLETYAYPFNFLPRSV